MSDFPGRLIALEGVDCAGKTSTLKLLPDLLADCRQRIVRCSELESPYSRVLTTEDLRTLSPALKAFLFATDRAWTFESTCLPALKEGALVLWDRYVDSALVYREVELGIRQSWISLDYVRDLNGCFPPADLTLLIDIPDEQVASRLSSSGAPQPYDATFLRKVASVYRALPHCVSINGSQPVPRIAADCALVIRRAFPGYFP